MQSDGSSAARPRVLLLFSGGIDSTMAAVILAARRVELYALSILFPGRPEAEVAIARTFSTELCFVTFLEVTLQLHAPLLPGDGPESYRGWIPYRNLVFWSIATHTAARVGATLIAAGHERSDADHFSDAGNAFFRKLERLLQYSGASSPRSAPGIELPLLTMPEAEFDLLASANLGLLDRTWSCWHDKPAPCASCFACRRRREYLAHVRTGTQ